MRQVGDIVFEIENLREELSKLIDEKIEFTDSKVVEVSQKLDAALNLYNKLVKNSEEQ